MPRMTGKHALAQMLIAEGIEHIFGNPGTSETPFLDGLQDYPQIKYVQALQEGTAVGMADGYARASGRPAFANIHIAGGLANGISALYNAYRGGAPVILTAGNSDTRMLLTEPVLSGDLVEMTTQYTKWSAEIRHASDIPMVIRRAFKEAKTPPTVNITSETPFLDGLQDYPQIKYVQALQEGTAVGMADGYARASGRPAFANIHIAGGLANGISALYNAYRGGAPVILTAGNSDTRMLLTEPVLSGDLVEMTTQYTKWSAEIRHASDIPMVIRRAFKEAKTPSTGPVFLSFPWDTLDEEVDADIIPSSPGYFRSRPDVDAVARASELLSQAENPVIVIGDRIAQSSAVPEMVKVAEQLGAKVYAAAYTEVNFPTSHSLFGGMLNLNSAATRQQPGKFTSV